MSATPVPVVSPPELPVSQTLVCGNCGAPLNGEYCAACGQRHEPHVHTIGHFTAEAFESITHADSRLWRTLGYLIAKPGRLTREFFDGRRARYLPPFRLYLVISLLFFLIAGLPGANDHETRGETSYEKVDELNKAAAELEANLADKPGGAVAAAKLREAATQEKARLDALRASGADAETMAAESRDSVHMDFCEAFKKPDPSGRWGYIAMQTFCKKMSHASGSEFVKSIVHNIPRAMFVFLPLLALFMKLLYWRPKRYYVEHLLFLVHNHAFVFLALAIATLLGSIIPDGNLFGFLIGFIWLYMFWYIFRAMRVFYGQSRSLTFAKYLVIGIAYISTSTLVLALTAIYSALML